MILEEQTALMFSLLKIEARTLSNILGCACKFSIAAVERKRSSEQFSPSRR
jgi:hypothetical protein